MNKDLEQLKELLKKMDSTTLEQLNSIVVETLSDVYDEEYGAETTKEEIEEFIDKAKLIMETTNHTWGDGKVPTKEQIKDVIYNLLEDIKSIEIDNDYEDDEIEVGTGGFEIKRIEEGIYELNYSTGIIIG